jgi:hypothetical protein
MIESGLDQHAVGGCKSLHNYAGLVAAGRGEGYRVGCKARHLLAWLTIRDGFRLVPYAMSSHGVTRLIVAAMTIWSEGLISSLITMVFLCWGWSWLRIVPLKSVCLAAHRV